MNDFQGHSRFVKCSILKAYFNSVNLGTMQQNLLYPGCNEDDEHLIETVCIYSFET